MSASTNITLQAAGDPTTFNMQFKVLRRDDGVMMKLTQYNVSDNQTGGTTIDSQNPINDPSKPLNYDNGTQIQTREGDKYVILKNTENTILSPTEDVAFGDSDIDAPDITGGTAIVKLSDGVLE